MDTHATPAALPTIPTKEQKERSSISVRKNLAQEIGIYAAATEKSSSRVVREAFDEYKVRHPVGVTCPDQLSYMYCANLNCKCVLDIKTFEKLAESKECPRCKSTLLLKLPG